MKHLNHFIFLLLISALPALGWAENLFENSSMDTTSTWKGDRDYEEEEGGNRVLVLEASPRKEVNFSQDVDTRDLTDLVLKFRYKSENYEGRGYELRGIREGGGSTFRARKLIADGKWHDVKWDFSSIRDSHEIIFKISLLEGEGEVYFDDVTVEAK